MKKFTALFGLLTILMLVLTACSPKTTEPTDMPTVVQPAAIIAEGRLMPVNMLDHSFGLMGYVSEVLVAEGDAVSIGQVLARMVVPPAAETALARAEQELLAAQQALDALSAEAELNLTSGRLAVVNAQEALDEAQQDYDLDATEANQVRLDAAAAQLKAAEDALAELEAGNGIDPDKLAAAEARQATANAALADAQDEIASYELKARVDGTIVGINVQPGQWATTGQTALTIADYSTWVVKTDNLTELDVVKVNVGQSVEVVLDALPNVTLEGTVSQINQRYEEKRGDITYTVTITLTKTDPQMRWGMTAAARFLP